MNAIFDSNIFIAAWHKGDGRRQDAVEILKKFISEEIKTIYITNYVLVEVVNFLLRKLRSEEVIEAYAYLTQTDRIKLIYVDNIMENEIKDLFFQYKELSLTDCSLLVLSKEFSIKNIYSFDGGFDKVKEVIRSEK